MTSSPPVCDGGIAINMCLVESDSAALRFSWYARGAGLEYRGVRGDDGGGRGEETLPGPSFFSHGRRCARNFIKYKYLRERCHLPKRLSSHLRLHD